MDLFTDDPPVITEDGAEDIPGDPVVVFLNRWSWRADRDQVEIELRELIADCQRSPSRDQAVRD